MVQKVIHRSVLFKVKIKPILSMLKESMYWLQLQLNLCLYLNTLGELGLHDKLL